MSLINYVTRIHFADDVLEEALQAELEAHRIDRPMVVTDAGLIECGLLDRLLSALPRSLAASVFEDTPATPTVEACTRAAAAYADNGCDGLIGFGGAAPIGLAKAVGLCLTHRKLFCPDTLSQCAFERVRGTLPPVIAVPTTSGSGAEVDRTIRIRLEDGQCISVSSSLFVPKVAICDPALTLRLPPHVTASAGMDALTHCIETYIAMAYNPPADGISLDGLRRAAANIVRAVEDGSDLEARREMMAAALNGALAMQKGLGAVHAMSHALGALPGCTIPHGVFNAVVTPHVLTFNAPAVDGRYEEIKHVMRLAPQVDLADAFARLAERLGLPTRLRELGIPDTVLEDTAQLAERDQNNRTNPRNAQAADYLRLLKAAF
jgi:alcohol dehydrogenase class IV